MAIIRLEAITSLAAAIVCEVPELEGRICIGQADPAKELGLPSLSIKPVKWRYFPDQADEVHDPAPDRVVMNVGRHEGPIQLRLAAGTPYQRAELEQKIVDVFLSTPLKPGILLTNVVACPALGDFKAAWQYDEDKWNDAPAFDQQFESLITLEGTVPALVTRRDSWTIQQLQLGLTHELTAAYTRDTFNTSPAVEVVQVNQDGTITPI